MSGNTIYPTHSCFDDAFEFFLLMMSERELAAGAAAPFRIAHGICVGAWEGDRFVHAWVEQLAPRPADCLVWQAGTLDKLDGNARVYYALPLGVFYSTWRVAECTAYTLAQAFRRNVETGMQGPWEPQYAALCRQRGDGRILGNVRGTVPVAIRHVSPSKWRAVQQQYVTTEAPPPKGH